MDNQLFLMLVARKLSGEATDEDINELANFLRDDVYKQKFDLLKGHWESKNNLKHSSASALEVVMSRIKERENQTRTENTEVVFREKSAISKFIVAFSKIAAILFLIAGGVYIMIQNTKPVVSRATVVAKEINWQSKQTLKGSKLTFILSDGTKIILNADSKIRFPETFSGNSREVYLIGEAFFDVAHNALMPFIIHTDKMNIKVLGTQFNVKSYPKDPVYETTLIKGSVEVTLNERPSDRIILKPKEKLIVTNLHSAKSTSFDRAAPRHSELTLTNLHYISQTDSSVVETSWVNNKIVFQDQSFESLAVDLERKYDVTIQFSNNAIKKYRFTGIFEKETIKEVLDALKLTEKFNYKIAESIVYIF